MARTVILFAGLLASCSPHARDIALADLDLSDMAKVQAIRSQLEPRDGIAFANYVARHHAKAVNYCGQPLTASNGTAPVTVGEAIDLVTLREAAERRAAIDAARPKHPRQLAQEGWDGLMRDRDMLVDAQSRLRMEFGDRAALRSEWKSLEVKMAEIDRKLIAIKPSVYGTGS